MIMRANEEFAKKNAGRYFLHRGLKVRVVGYCSENGHSILLAMAQREPKSGWSAKVLESTDVFVTHSHASRYCYADKESLKEWIRK